MQTRHSHDLAIFKRADSLLRKVLYVARLDFFICKLSAIDLDAGPGLELWRSACGLSDSLKIIKYFRNSLIL